MEQIVVYKQRIGDTNYISGDGIDVAELIKRQLLNEGVVKQLTKTQEIVPLTPEAFAVAIARRPAGAPWPPRGFTQGFLEEKGLIEPGFTTDAPAAAAAPKTKAVRHRAKAAAAPLLPPPKSGETLTHVAIGRDAIQVGTYFLQPTKRGNLHFFTAAAEDGRILRATMFKSLDAGTKFLQSLSTAPPAPATPGAEPTAEDSDDSDLRSEPDGAEG